MFPIEWSFQCRKLGSDYSIHVKFPSGSPIDIFPDVLLDWLPKCRKSILHNTYLISVFNEWVFLKFSILIWLQTQKRSSENQIRKWTNSYRQSLRLCNQVYCLCREALLSFPASKYLFPNQREFTYDHFDKKVSKYLYLITRKPNICSIIQILYNLWLNPLWSSEPHIRDNETWLSH